MILNRFYEEPDGDRWFPYDRHARRLIRRIARGPRRVGGQERVFLNLCAGLEKIGVRFRCNDYSHITQHPDELVCIVGKPFVLDKIRWRNPILFGASVFSHPIEDPRLFERLPVKRVLVPGEWMRRMWEPYFGDRVTAWPVGIDTDHWAPADTSCKDTDVLIYNKIRWNHEEMERTLVEPARNIFRKKKLSFVEIRYGHYEEREFRSQLDRCRTMIFICEHESQGIAYQQALAAGVPILAWDRGGYWEDPAFYPHKVKYGPVTSVPYWDKRCGLKFSSIHDLPERLDTFLSERHQKILNPREFILDNLTLERCALVYARICEELIAFH
jgi:glycosyltransferase involved in cell wall biosynthesis